MQMFVFKYQRGYKKSWWLVFQRPFSLLNAYLCVSAAVSLSVAQLWLQYLTNFKNLRESLQYGCLLMPGCLLIPRLVQRAAEDGLDYGYFSWLPRSSTPLSKLPVLAHIWPVFLWAACHVCQKHWKGTWNISAQFIESNILLALYTLWIEERWRSNLLQAMGCSFHFLFLFYPSVKL